MHEEILEIFEGEYSKILKPTVQEELKSSSSKAILGAITYYRKTSKFSFDVVPDEKNAFIKFNSLTGVVFTVEETF